jgi:hypothetical protein
MANPNTRRIFLTGSFAATIISGSLLGAYIKMNQEAKQVRIYSSSSYSYFIYASAMRRTAG